MVGERGSKARVAGDAPVIREAKGLRARRPHVRRPFDDCPAAAGVAHRVIPWDGCRRRRGTGIVHIAPGCGQEDFALSKAFDLPVIDPIDEFGVFVDGFGWQTGRVAGSTDDRATDLARTWPPTSSARAAGGDRALHALLPAGAAARS